MDGAWLAGRFAADGTRLRAVAYRLLGSPGEADDAVQGAWLRLSRADTGAVERLGGWLTTGAARTARDTVSRTACAKLSFVSGSASASDPATLCPPILWPGVVHHARHALSQERAARMASARRAVGHGNDTSVSRSMWPGLRSWPPGRGARSATATGRV
jgi:DNA-directed RNA polymerase specialized sigma24 family protein